MSNKEIFSHSYIKWRMKLFTFYVQIILLFQAKFVQCLPKWKQQFSFEAMKGKNEHFIPERSVTKNAVVVKLQ